MSNIPPSMRNPALLWFGIALGVGGCGGPSSADIQLWKTTERGPDKLEQTLKQSSVAPKLRAEAAAALGEIDRAERVDIIFASIPAAERWEILKTLIPIHAAGLKDASVEKARAARDALFSVRQYAPTEETVKIDESLRPAIEADLRAGRFSGGRHSVEKMLTALGTQSGPMLAGLLREPLSTYQGIAELLAKIGDDGSREKGAVALVNRAAKEKPIPVAMWRALGVLGGQAALEFMMRTSEKEGPDAVRAVQALQQRREPAVLTFALKLAGDPKTPKEVRQEAFGAVEKVGGLNARDGAVKIIAQDRDDVVRFIAYETALGAAGTEAIRVALEAFPGSTTYKREDINDFLVKDIEKIADGAKPGSPARAALLDALVNTLSSPAPLARLTVVLALERLGTAREAEAVAKLSSDTGVVKGVGQVGKEASRIAPLLRAKS